LIEIDSLDAVFHSDIIGVRVAVVIALSLLLSSSLSLSSWFLVFGVDEL